MKTKDSDGIIYPSVPAQGGGFNVAIKPNAADTKIRFVGASLCHLLKHCHNEGCSFESRWNTDIYRQSLEQRRNGNIRAICRWAYLCKLIMIFHTCYPIYLSGCCIYLIYYRLVLLGYMAFCLK